MLKVIKVNELTPGMMITQVIEQNGPVKIRKVGLVKSKDMITGLAEMGVISVEIDPEQSIELAPETAPTSMTQKLLQGEYDHASQVDRSLSEQFNRSLFLPSVSELPSTWQLVLKQIGMIATVIIMGFAVGFGVAVLPTLIDKTQSVTEIDESSREIQTEKSSDLDREEVISEEGLTLTVISDETRETSMQPSEDSASESSADTTLDIESTSLPLSEVSEESTGLEDELAAGGNLLTQQEDMNLNRVSPELLERFNKALEDIESGDTDDTPETKVTVVNDLPRVDQLPARTLTLLPSMTFSAHMYASSKQERWVRVNGQRLYEGEWVNDDVQLINIEPQRVVLSFRGELFTMAALTDW